VKTNRKKSTVIRGWVWVGLSGVVLQSVRETRAKCVLWAERAYPGPPREHGRPERVDVRVGVGARGIRDSAFGIRGKAGRA